MGPKISYGQYCPLAMSSEFLCNRWTLLVLRELLLGSTSFNDIGRGVPRMSRTLLSSRLKELVEIGILAKQKSRKNTSSHYELTESGQALGPVVMSLAGWGQQWLEVEPSLKNFDTDVLMWDIRRNTNPFDELPDPFIVHFCLTDVPENESDYWLVFEKGHVDLCHIDESFKVDVELVVSVRKLTKVWMGWEDFSTAVADGSLTLDGPKKYTSIAEKWLGHSSVAHIKKNPPERRVNY